MKELILSIIFSLKKKHFLVEILKMSLFWCFRLVTHPFVRQIREKNPNLFYLLVPFKGPQKLTFFLYMSYVQLILLI